MQSWRFEWALAEISNFSNYSRHGQILHSSWKFWLALLLKFMPRLWPFQIELRLKQGGVVGVNEFMTLYIYKEIFVDGCYDVPLPASGDPLIIDVGANTGLFIIRMKQLYPRSRVFGYEPVPSNYAQLERNLELSGCDDCEIFRRGVAGLARKEKLYIHRSNIGGHSIHKSEAGGDDHIEIDLVDIDGMLQPLNGKPCDLLKLDCEGAEYEIIKGISKETAKKIKKIVFEVTPTLYDTNEVAEHLRNIGYRLGRHKGLWLADYQEETQA